VRLSGRRHTHGSGGRSLVGVSTIVHVPEELAERLAAEAARRQGTVEELAVELVSAGLGATGESALDAFIASGDSGDPTWAGRDIHELRSELATRRADETP
jgi:hypothetical protein